MKEIVSQLDTGSGVPEEEIIRMAEEKGISQSEAEEVLAKLKRGGDVFEPKPGFYKKM